MKKYLPAYIVLIIAIVLSVGAWRFALSVNERYVNSQFETECNVIEQRLNFWLEPNGAVLDNLQGMFHNVVQIVRDIFELYVSIPESSHPGVQAIGYAPKIPRSDIKTFVLYARNEGYFQYELTPPGDRPVYFPAQYVVPITTNRKTSGFDLYSHPELRAAIDKAVTSNSICATPLVSPTRDKDSTIFFLLPIYETSTPDSSAEARRNETKGVCFIELHVRSFIEHALHFNYDSSRISFTIHDGADANAPLIFGIPSEESRGLRYTKSMRVFDRTWTLVFSERQALAALRSDLILPDVILYSGLIIGLILFTIISIFIGKVETIKKQTRQSP